MALFPGAWNPPTAAHLAIAEAALGWADEVAWVLPEVFPHKSFDGASLPERLELLRAVAAANPRFSVATTRGGLYFEMADEAAEAYGPSAEIGLVCGRDAAERIAAWNYGRPGVFEAMLERYCLLVAARHGTYLPAPGLSRRIVTLPVEGDWDHVSSTEVRKRIQSGDPLEDLIPFTIVARVRELYGPPPGKIR